MSYRIFASKLLILSLAGLCLWGAYCQRPTLVYSAPHIHLSIGDQILAQLDPAFAGYKLLFELHHLGDMEGRLSPLTDYDFKTLAQMLEHIDKLLPHTDLTALLAASYFSHSPNPEHLQEIALYLSRYSNHNLQQRWPWLLRALYITCKCLSNPHLSQQLASPLLSLKLSPKDRWVKNVTVWLTAENCHSAKIHK
jgi:hypothetical protein